MESLSDDPMEMESMELDSINTTVASGAMNALMSAVTPGWTSSPKRSRPVTDDPSTKKKKLKLSGSAVREKVMAMRDSDLSSLSSTESDSQSLLFSQEYLFDTFDIRLNNMHITLLNLFDMIDMK